MSERHKPGALKQQNKPHKKLSKAKAQQNAGRVEALNMARRKKPEAKRAERRNHAKQIREQKRTHALEEKRGFGGDKHAPMTVGLIGLSDREQDVAKAYHLLSGSLEGSGSEFVVNTFLNPKLKKRFTLVPVPDSLESALSVGGVADTLLFIVSKQGIVSETAHGTLKALCAQGCPTPNFAILDFDDVSPKHKSDVKKSVGRQVEAFFPEIKLHTLSSAKDADALLWSLVNQKAKTIYWRKNRPHVLAEHADFIPSVAPIEGDLQHNMSITGTLVLSGYLHFRNLNTNKLIYLPGLGARQIEKVVVPLDPCPLKASHHKDVSDESMASVFHPNHEKQESLDMEAEVDPLDAEQTWPTEEELADAAAERRKRMLQKPVKLLKVPRGCSSYQAAWIGEEVDEIPEEGNADEDGVDGEDASGLQHMRDAEGREDGGDSDEDDDDELGSQQDDYELAMPMVDNPQDGEDDWEAKLPADGAEKFEYVSVAGESEIQDPAKYDAQMNMEDEQQALEKFRAASEDALFPDEVDTPLHVPARVRFQKYRGLQSFQNSEWDPKEDLPLHYSKIFQFANFNATLRRVLKDSEDDQDEIVPCGHFVQVHVKDVPFAYASNLLSRLPLVAFGLLDHENKFSAVHFRVQILPNLEEPIKSKEPLIFFTGVRRFSARPVFSSNTLGSKHKFERFVRAGQLCVASAIAPVQYPPSPILVFREKEGELELVATGSLLSVNPDRLVIKRIRLSGHPYKINKRSSSIRHMFFNPEDIYYFKPVELLTRYGRRGHIKESLGTHGHMKCVFDGPVNSQDTVLMNLYKRVFPKPSYIELDHAPLNGLLLRFPTHESTLLEQMG